MQQRTLMSRRGVRQIVLVALTLLVAAIGASASVAPPAEAALASGPYTCKSGFVWREAFAGDRVCVTPATRDAVRNENQNAWWRTSNSGTPRWCVSGYVWREARPTDFVCVPPASRDRERSNNNDAVFRLEDPSATPRHAGVWSYDDPQRFSTGGYVRASGGGLSPYGAAKFYAMNRFHNGASYGPYSMSTLSVDGAGRIASGSSIGFLYCNRNLAGPGVIVVADSRSGTVNTTGTTNAFSRCGF